MENNANSEASAAEQDILDTILPGVDGECDVDDILGEDCVRLTHHNFLDTDPTDDEKASYIKSFAIILASTGGRESKYLNAVSNLFGCGAAADETYKLAEDLKAGNRRAEVIDALKVVSSGARQVHWIMDAFVVGTDSGAAEEKAKAAVLKVADRLFRPLPGENARDNFLSFVSALTTVATTNVAIEEVEREVGDTLRENVESGLCRGILEYYGFGALLKKCQTSQIGIAGSGIEDEPSGMEIQTLGPCDFLCQDVISTVSFHGFWYVLCVRDGTLELLKSDDAENWDSVELPDGLTNEESEWHANWNWFEIVLKSIDGNLLIVAPRRNMRSFWYSSDGINFKEIEQAFDNYVTDVFRVDKWYLQTSRDVPYSYTDGKLFKTTEHASYSKTVFFCADELDGEWSECVDLNFGDGRTLVVGSVFATSRSGLLAVSEYSGLYAWNCKLEGKPELGYIPSSDWEWKRASCNGSFKDISGLYTFCDFAELDCGGFIFSAYDRNPSDLECDQQDHGVFYSRGGRAWKHIHAPFHTPFFKLGNWICAFTIKIEGEQVAIQLCATRDGEDYKCIKVPLPCMPIHIASNGDTVLLMSNDDKAYLGRLV